MLLSLTIALMVAAFAGPVPAQAQDASAQMTIYQMVLLKKGPNGPPASPEAQKTMQEEHLAALADLNRKRIALLYGPVTEDAELRGIAILDVPTPDDARKAFAEDPFVKSRVMTADVRPWYGPKNWFSPPASYDVTNPASLEPLVLGFLVRGPNTGQDKETAAEIQKGHLAYMDSLHSQGKLLVAGPFGDKEPARGLVIYRVKTVADAKALAADDPAVKAGRLVLEAYPWMTFKGILK
jgi:uncharacterized protein YciI